MEQSRKQAQNTSEVQVQNKYNALQLEREQENKETHSSISSSGGNIEKETEINNGFGRIKNCSDTYEEFGCLNNVQFDLQSIAPDESLSYVLDLMLWLTFLYVPKLQPCDVLCAGIQSSSYSRDGIVSLSADKVSKESRWIVLPKPKWLFCHLWRKRLAVGRGSDLDWLRSEGSRRIEWSFLFIMLPNFRSVMDRVGSL
ncbi:hypothetical protein HAX54_048428 [Datura stramonium]|uniref:Uncharacterized protein n=1 Tax=Datura stramonium TaxID=4076 RepID=A0ABS8RHC1_DATST|nr:hypothetical protein [Datura stramonium]